MSALIRLECVLTEDLAYSQRAHLKLVPADHADVFAPEDVQFLSSHGKLTVDVPDSSSAITFERGKFYRAEITEEI